MKKSNWLCFGMPVTEEPTINVVRVSRLPTFRPPPKPENHYIASPKFDDRKGVEKPFGMAKWRKSQKILRDKKQTKDHDYVPPQHAFQERAVDVPNEYRAENVSKENLHYKSHSTHVYNSYSDHGSKSCTNTPNLSRNRNRSKKFSRSKKASQSVPTRRVKNFVPYDQ